jgi:hypothetical protein
VGLWHYLVKEGFHRAAVGLLEDFLWRLEAIEHLGPTALGLKEDMSRDAQEAIRHNYRQWLREMLGDKDGRLLQQWRQSFAEYQDAEAQLRPPFVRGALRRVQGERASNPDA